MPRIADVKKERVWIYDTTLRDGTQGPGVSLSLADKLLIARKLDDLGVDYIEGGYPLSNPKDETFFVEIQKIKLRHSKIAAFGMTRRKGVKVEEDTSIQALIASKAPVVTIVGKGDEYQVKKILAVSLAENIEMVTDSIKHCKRKGREVIFDAEHFFDGFKRSPEYSLEVLTAAVNAGATTLCLCDTNGGTLPTEVFDMTSKVVQAFNGQVIVAFHAHNDSNLAVANSLEAVRAGARGIQGTINGIGERCGNADLTSILPNLAIKMGYEVLPSPENLKKLTETSRYVYEVANLNPRENQPFVGVSAFAHKGGMHVHAIMKDTASYEHVSPETVGNSRKILVSELSGASNVKAKSVLMEQIEDKNLVRKILTQVQDLENEGYQFETADASFHLLVLKALGRYKKLFDLLHYRIAIYRKDGNHLSTEAIVKLDINGSIEHQVAEGDGPVNALDAAMRKALLPYYPKIAELTLTDYKVRIINSRAGTAAKTRVIIESSDKHERWGTIGVSENIVDASWRALADSIEYMLLKDKK
ncbi:MAG: citramalate synthase [Phycisphaerae bacterium]|nr:citramalate synthase [Phycisphaerae bacterium]